MLPHARQWATTVFWKRVPVCFAFGTAGLLSAAPGHPPIAEGPYPPISNSLNLRVTNRRFISEIRFENADGQNYLTLIVTNGPAYWAFKSRSFPLHYECGTPKQCLNEARRLDEHLRKGWNLGLVLSGSWISEFVYLTAPVP